MHRFYSEELESNLTEIVLNELESNHACKVLRLTQGASIEVINGRGLLAIGQISHDHAKRCQVEILSSSFTEKPKRPIHIAICPTKSNDRFEWFLEKAVEIGVDEITPLWSENSERSKLNFERLDKVILSAVKQSLRTHLAKLNPLIKVKDFIHGHPSSLITHCNTNFQRCSWDELKYDNELTLMIGPEGDFSVSELEYALHQGLKSVSLGNNRLRTETAGVVCATLLNMRRL